MVNAGLFQKVLQTGAGGVETRTGAPTLGDAFSKEYGRPAVAARELIAFGVMRTVTEAIPYFQRDLVDLDVVEEFPPTTPADKERLLVMFVQVTEAIEQDEHLRELFEIMQQLHQASQRYEEGIVEAGYGTNSGFFAQDNFHSNVIMFGGKPDGLGDQVMELQAAHERLVDYVRERQGLGIEELPYDEKTFGKDDNRMTLQYRRHKGVVLVVQKGFLFDAGELLHEIAAYHFITQGLSKRRVRSGRLLAQRKGNLDVGTLLVFEAILSCRQLYELG